MFRQPVAAQGKTARFLASSGSLDITQCSDISSVISEHYTDASVGQHLNISYIGGHQRFSAIHISRLHLDDSVPQQPPADRKFAHFLFILCKFNQYTEHRSFHIYFHFSISILAQIIFSILNFILMHVMPYDSAN